MIPRRRYGVTPWSRCPKSAPAGGGSRIAGLAAAQNRFRAREEIPDADAEEDRWYGHAVNHGERGGRFSPASGTEGQSRHPRAGKVPAPCGWTACWPMSPGCGFICADAGGWRELSGRRWKNRAVARGSLRRPSGGVGSGLWRSRLRGHLPWRTFMRCGCLARLALRWARAPAGHEAEGVVALAPAIASPLSRRILSAFTQGRYPVSVKLHGQGRSKKRGAGVGRKGLWIMPWKC